MLGYYPEFVNGFLMRTGSFMKLVKLSSQPVTKQGTEEEGLQ